MSGRRVGLALLVAMVPLVALGVAAYAIAQSAAGDESRADADRAGQLAAEVLEQRLAAAHDGVIGIVGRLIVAHVSGIDQLTISAGEAAALVAG